MIDKAEFEFLKDCLHSYIFHETRCVENSGFTSPSYYEDELNRIDVEEQKILGIIDKLETQLEIE